MVLCPPNQYTRGGRESVSGPPGPRAQVAVALRNRVPPDCLAPLSRGARGSAWAVPEAGYCFCPLPPFPCLPNPAPGCRRAACSLQPPSSGPGGAALKRSALWPLEALRAPGWSRLPSCPQRSSLPRSWLPALRNSASFSGQSAETGKTFPGHQVPCESCHSPRGGAARKREPELRELGLRVPCPPLGCRARSWACGCSTQTPFPLGCRPLLGTFALWSA